MHTNKRGLSDIVTTVFIIVLVIVAIVLIWSFVRPAIERGGTRVQSGSECLTLDLEVVACKVNAAADTITVKRNPGAGEMKSLKLVVGDNVFDTDPDPTLPASSRATGTSAYPAELQTIVYTLPSTVTILAGTSANVGGVLAGGQVCPPTRDVVICA